jgi:hypothetical protein
MQQLFRPRRRAVERASKVSLFIPASNLIRCPLSRLQHSSPAFRV